MQIPNKLKICGLDYKVQFDDDMVTREGLSGQHEPNQLIIKLQRKNYDQQKIEQCFFHEIIHAINTHYCGIQELTENQTDNVGNGLYQVLKDNNLLK